MNDRESETMFGPLTHDQAKAAARCIAALRPEWDAPGILDALGRARGRGDAPTVVIAALRAAMNPTNRTPAVIPLDGAHWRPDAPDAKGAARQPAKAGALEECQIHVGEYVDRCRGCAADALVGDESQPPRRVVHHTSTDPTPGYLAARRATE